MSVKQFRLFHSDKSGKYTGNQMAANCRIIDTNSYRYINILSKSKEDSLENRKDLERLNFEQRKKLPSPSFDDPMGRYLGEGDDVEGVYEQFGA